MRTTSPLNKSQPAPKPQSPFDTEIKGTDGDDTFRFRTVAQDEGPMKGRPTLEYSLNDGDWVRLDSTNKYVRFSGGDGNDKFEGDVPFAEFYEQTVVVLDGGAGHDEFSLQSTPFRSGTVTTGRDFKFMAFGGEGHDVYQGGSGRDFFSGGAGHDTIVDHRGGTNFYLGGDGDDRLVVTGGVNQLHGSKGNDTIVAHNVIKNVVDGGLGNDKIVVSAPSGVDNPGNIIGTGAGRDHVDSSGNNYVFTVGDHNFINATGGKVVVGATDRGYVGTATIEMRTDNGYIDQNILDPDNFARDSFLSNTPSFDRILNAVVPIDDQKYVLDATLQGLKSTPSGQKILNKNIDGAVYFQYNNDVSSREIPVGNVTAEGYKAAGSLISLKFAPVDQGVSDANSIATLGHELIHAQNRWNAPTDAIDTGKSTLRMEDGFYGIGPSGRVVTTEELAAVGLTDSHSGKSPKNVVDASENSIRADLGLEARESYSPPIQDEKTVLDFANQDFKWHWTDTEGLGEVRKGLLEVTTTSESGTSLGDHVTNWNKVVSDFWDDKQKPDAEKTTEANSAGGTPKAADETTGVGAGKGLGNFGESSNVQGNDNGFDPGLMQSNFVEANYFDETLAFSGHQLDWSLG